MREEINQNTKPVEVYQAVIAFLVLLSIVIATAVNISSRITALEIKQAGNEAFQVEMKLAIDKVIEGQTEILIKLEGKENRVAK